MRLRIGAAVLTAHEGLGERNVGDVYAIASAVSFLKELACARSRCRTDPEPAIKRSRGYSHQVVGRRSRSRAGLARGDDSSVFGASRFDIEDSFGSVVGVAHQCVLWLARHATWLPFRIQRKQNGATPLENLKRVTGELMAKGGHGRQAVRVACGLAKGITTRWRVLPASRRFWWHVRKNFEPQKLKP